MQTISREKLFGKLNFQKLDKNPDFKEDSVREVIVLPILRELGYTQDNIVRSKTLRHPFLKIGSKKKRPITLIPDYVLKVEENYAWVLDAKAPDQKITESDNVEQVYSYASHPEIRSTYFALCNGKNFVLFRREQTNKPILDFALDEIEYHWEKMKMLLSPESFQLGKLITYDTTNATAKPTGFNYNNRPLLEEIPVRKRAVKRHFGVHGYFTKQTWNVVAEYIKNYSKPSDLVLDPFGGSGITAIEALMNDRRTIHIDLNPMSVFMVQALIAPVKPAEFSKAFYRVKTVYEKSAPSTEDEIKKALKKYPYPKGFRLPKGSDVESIEGLFTDKQLAQLAFLKHLISKFETSH